MEPPPSPPPVPAGSAPAAVPPPVPVQPVRYAGLGTPGAPTPEAAHEGTAQAVFDTVAGPNVRLKDNLIQLLCCAAGAVIGGWVGAFLAPGGERRFGVLVGVVLGLVAALFLSGVVIGVVRFFTAVKKRR